MKNTFLLAGCALSMCLAFGCADTRVSRVESDFGTAYELSKYNQIADPEAEKNLEPVEGLNAGPAWHSYDKYERSFQREDQKVDFSITIEE